MAFFIPKPLLKADDGLGEGSIGMTAGKGMDGAGETDRREENEDRRLWLMTLGGFMGSANDVGVPGAEGTGDPMEGASRTASDERWPKSGGAGLLEEIRRGGRSALMWLASLGVLSSWLSVYCPSLVFKE